MRRAGDEEEDFLIIIQVDVFLPLCPEHRGKNRSSVYWGCRRTRTS